MFNLVTSPDDWRNRAACLPPIDATPAQVRKLADDFFPIADDAHDAHGRHSDKFMRQAERALAMCARCPVVRDCLSEALGWDKDGHAIAGGKTPGQRSLIRKDIEREADKAAADAQRVSAAA